MLHNQRIQQLLRGDQKRIGMAQEHFLVFLMMLYCSMLVISGVSPLHCCIAVPIFRMHASTQTTIPSLLFLCTQFLLANAKSAKRKRRKDDERDAGA